MFKYQNLSSVLKVLCCRSLKYLPFFYNYCVIIVVDLYKNDVNNCLLHCNVTISSYF